MKLIGPFHQIISLTNLKLKGKISDSQLEIITNGGVLVNNSEIEEVGNFSDLKEKYPKITIEKIETPQVLLPSFTDCHTHICFSGDRSHDFTMRNSGKTYLEIAESGGGIWNTVINTRKDTEEQLIDSLVKRIKKLQQQGIATIEIKSGYGQTVKEELKMLRAINKTQAKTPVTLVATCLAAHSIPKDFAGSSQEYLQQILTELLPKVKEENLSNRVDIFIEKSAFQPKESKEFLLKAKEMGFDITVHADQFTPGSSRIAAEVEATSADHLEAIIDADISFLAESQTTAVALPGASLGLGEPFAPARKLLDAGASVAIATDWNPGSAPMGNLITQASALAAYQKLSSAEIFAGITFRAAHTLKIKNQGKIQKGYNANFVAFPTDNFYQILYNQGSLTPCQLWINGIKTL